MEDFAVTCPLVPDVPHLRSGSCTSPCIFELGFLQTPPRDGALALLLTFGSAKTWYGDLHPVSYVPCLAHTLLFSGRTLFALRCKSLVKQLLPRFLFEAAESLPLIPRSNSLP